MTIISRLAVADDLEFCLAFDRKEIHPPPIAEHRKLIAGHIMAENIYVSEDLDEDILVGYIRLDRIWTHMMPLVCWMYVEPAYRSRGITFQLRSFVFENLRSRGFDRLLYSVQADRPQMIQFMMGMNFEPVGQLTKVNPDESIAELFFMQRL
jgi:GNAT superfamily N-acetyltransferase